MDGRRLKGHPLQEPQDNALSQGDAGKSGGEFFTPADVSELLTRLGTVGKTEVNKVYDPACGSGSLLLKAGKVLFRVPFSQLVYVEVNQKHLYFNLTDGSVREVPGVLRQYEAQLLAREEFMRIHRSYIVNMLQVAAFAPTEVRTFSGKSLPVSRLLYPQLQKDYLALLFHGRKE